MYVFMCQFALATFKFTLPLKMLTKLALVADTLWPCATWLDEGCCYGLASVHNYFKFICVFRFKI